VVSWYDGLDAAVRGRATGSLEHTQRVMAQAGQVIHDVSVQAVIGGHVSTGVQVSVDG